VPPRKKQRTKPRNGDAQLANGQVALPFVPPEEEHLDLGALETWLWDAACAIRGATDAPKFKDYILPLIFFKRLSDVFDDEFAEQVELFGDAAVAHEIVQADHADALAHNRPPIVRFYVPDEYRWAKVRNHPADGRLGEFVTKALHETARLNPDLQGVLDVEDFNERQAGQRILDDDRLAELIEVISRHRLGLRNTAPDVIGQAYEYLLRKFAEGQGQSAGEFYTPMEVGRLIAEVIDPFPKSTVYDCACGSGGLLIKTRIVFAEHNPTKLSQAPRLYGQELNATTFAMARMNMILHGYSDARIAIGDTFRNPAFEAAGAGLKAFDYVVANPMWNQDNYDDTFYENDPRHRFVYGTPPKSSADWGWVQHILASLNDTGRAAVVLDTGAVSRGSGGRQSNREKEIRKALVEKDVIEGAILLPDNLFYNTTAPGIVLVLNRDKPAERRGQMILVNASAYFVKEKPKNVLTAEGIRAVAEAVRAWETRPKLSRVITLEEVRAADYNLSPSQFVEVNDRVQHRPLTAIVADLHAAAVERQKADAELADVLGKLGLNGGGRG
jgi:type I restriction enzyme M protein